MQICGTAVTACHDIIINQLQIYGEHKTTPGLIEQGTFKRLIFHCVKNECQCLDVVLLTTTYCNTVQGLRFVAELTNQFAAIFYTTSSSSRNC